MQMVHTHTPSFTQLCHTHTHTIFHIQLCQTHSFVLLLGPPPPPLSFLPSPPPLQHLVLIIGRDCLVGLSGPLISLSDGLFPRFFFQCVEVDAVGNAWVAGYVFLMKFDAQGVHQWTRQHGGQDDGKAYSLQVDGVWRSLFSNLFYGGTALDFLRGPCYESGGMAFMWSGMTWNWYPDSSDDLRLGMTRPN